MSISTRGAAIAVACAALIALPASANAQLPQLRGVVSGSPYGASGGQMAIPVLFSKQTLRKTGLKSPVGVIILKRNQRVKLPNGAGYALPVNLRNGDRFKGYGPVSSVNKRTFYPRVVLKKRPAVYFRSKELSLGELTIAVQSLQSALARLQTQLTSLRDGSIKAFQDVYAQLADLKGALAALGALKLPDFQSQIDALSAKLDGLLASGGVVTTLQSQVTTLQSQLSTVCSAVKNATVALPAPLSVSVPVVVNTGGVC